MRDESGTASSPGILSSKLTEIFTRREIANGSRGFLPLDSPGKANGSRSEGSNASHPKTIGAAAAMISRINDTSATRASGTRKISDAKRKPAISTIYTKIRPTETRHLEQRRPVFLPISLCEMAGLRSRGISLLHPLSARRSGSDYFELLLVGEARAGDGVAANDRRNSTNCHRCSSVKRFLNAGIGRCPSLIL